MNESCLFYLIDTTVIVLLHWRRFFLFSYGVYTYMPVPDEMKQKYKLKLGVFISHVSHGPYYQL